MKDIMVWIKSHWLIILAVTNTKSSLKKLASVLRKNVLSTEWTECLFSFNTGRGGRRIERRKGAKDFFLCRNVACHLTSVEQNFLIKTEGLEGRVLHFTLDSLNPRRHWRSVPVGGTVWRRRFLRSAAHSRHCLRREQHREKSLLITGKSLTCGRTGVGVTHYI